MSEGIITSLLALLGTVIGRFAGILTSSRLTLYRLERLEEKVEQHNRVVERVFKLEESAKSAHHRLDEIRSELDRKTGA